MYHFLVLINVQVQIKVESRLQGNFEAMICQIFNPWLLKHSHEGTWISADNGLDNMRNGNSNPLDSRSFLILLILQQQPPFCRPNSSTHNYDGWGRGFTSHFSFLAIITGWLLISRRASRLASSLSSMAFIIPNFLNNLYLTFHSSHIPLAQRWIDVLGLKD